MDIDTLIFLLNKYNDEGFYNGIRILRKGEDENFYPEELESVILDSENSKILLVPKYI